MKKISTRILALLAAMTMLFAGCSESDSSGSDSKKTESSSQSQTESSSDADSSDSADEGDDSTSGADVPDVIPWDYDVPDPSGNTKPQEDSSQSSSDSSHKQSENTTAAPAATTAKQQTTAAAPRQTTAAPKATTKAATAAPKPTPAPSGTPVQRHGALHISGNHIVDSKGQVFMLQGMSTHGIMWEDFSNILSANSLKVLRDDWKCNAVRIAMYTEEWGGYTTGSGYAAQAKQKVISGVAQATNLGMYVIIDWHILKDGNPQKHQSEAIAFFTEMANRYKNQSNVIFELCNEPNGGVSWNGGIKSYCQSVVNAIRTYDKNAVIVCGTGTWSQDIDQVVGNRLSDKNCVYALHFYANTHTDWLRNRLQTCYNKGLPVLVSEFGTCDASGNGGFNKSQTQAWLKLLDSLNVGYINWSASNKNETASAFKPGTNLRAISSGTSQLTDSGKLVREWYRAH